MSPIPELIFKTNIHIKDVSGSLEDKDVIKIVETHAGENIKKHVNYYVKKTQDDISLHSCEIKKKNN